jgi:hypothetical protein
MSILQKFLAQIFRSTEAAALMDTISCSINRVSALAAVALSFAFLWTLALSVSPQLHQKLHSDANQIDHSCAVTFVALGNYSHSAHPPLVCAPLPVVQFSKIQALTPQWVESPFLGACIFEHAPPAHS